MNGRDAVLLLIALGLVSSVIVLPTGVLLTALIIAGAAGQTAWCLVYGFGPWRATPIGWVWLFKGSCLAVMLNLLAVERFRDLPDALWVVVAVAFVTAIYVWLATTWAARREDFTA